MSVEFNELLNSFDKGIKKKEEGKFGEEDVQNIYSAASKLFDGSTYLDQNQIIQIRDRWIQLAEGKIDKSKAMKKLQGTSRAEAIRSVLLSSL